MRLILSHVIELKFNELTKILILIKRVVFLNQFLGSLFDFNSN